MTSQNDKFPPLFKADDNDWKNNARILPEHYRGEFYMGREYQWNRKPG
ncbi:hypothetical protein LC605_26620 [Nostoc sp. CHAB 5836]|nr:hypothetical protein [Nostoc sp. CHAB 5836]MCC5618598.1 hypothetical protein [Nostoc sp. CHAB 5836]